MGSTTGANIIVKYPVTMRASPTLSQSSTGLYDGGAAVLPFASFGTIDTGNNSLNAVVVISGGTFVAKDVVIWQANNSASAYIDLSSEL